MSLSRTFVPAVMICAWKSLLRYDQHHHRLKLGRRPVFDVLVSCLFQNFWVVAFVSSQNRQHYSQLSALKSEISDSVLTSGGLIPVENGKAGDRILPVGDGALKLAVKDWTVENGDVYSNCCK